MDEVLILVGTMKGVFRFRSRDGVSWRPEAPRLTEGTVHTTAYDPARKILYAAANSYFYGPTVRRSTDLGETWDQGVQLAYGPDDPEKVTAIWSLQPAGDTLYAGVEASGLFASDDGGDTWREVGSLRAHPTHDTWNPGAGGKCLHSIAVDPHDPNRLFVAASTGGCYRSDDRGASWRPANRGVVVLFAPDDQRYPESGQCVHRIALTAGRKDRLWLQNHGGVYRSDDGGDSWQTVGEGLPADFGFPVVAHPRRADTAFVAPLTADMARWSPENQLAVYRTDDGGATWRGLRRGLPAPTYTGILRDAFCADGAEPLGLYFGTTSGSVFASLDEGETWTEVANQLPRVLSVRAVREAP
jgi:photosystem II stability/assembly factor-like uncharacterized protein